MECPQKKKVPIFNVEAGPVRTRNELEKLNVHLEDKVRERTEDLSCEIAQRERAEAALREERERYRELFENANDILYTLDLAGRVTSLNAAGEQIIGHNEVKPWARASASSSERNIRILFKACLTKKPTGSTVPLTNWRLSRGM